MSVVYVKFLHYENGVTHNKQKVCTVLNEDEYGNVTVKMYNDKIKNHETRILRVGQFSTTPFLMDFD